MKTEINTLGGIFVKFLKDATKISALTIFLAGLWIFYTTTTFKYTGSDPMGPAKYPAALAIVMMLMCIILLFSKIVEEKKEDKEKAYKPLLITLSATIIYVCILNLVGFIPSTILYLFTLSMYLGGGKLKTSIIYSICFTSFLYVLFRVFLGILLPKIPIF